MYQWKDDSIVSVNANGWVMTIRFCPTEIPNDYRFFTSFGHGRLTPWRTVALYRVLKRAQRAAEQLYERGERIGPRSEAGLR